MSRARECAQCGCPLAKGDVLCPNCGNPRGAFRAATAGARPCPCGIGKLRRARTGGIEAMPCRHCGGIWFRWGELGKLLRRQRFRLAGSTSPWIRPRSYINRRRTRIPCPRCRVPMRKGAYGRSSGIIVDWCRGHGVWLDPRELRHLLRFAHRAENRWALLETALRPMWPLRRRR